MRDHRSGLLAKNDFGPRARGQFAMPADEVRMQMRLDHILDRQTVRGSFVDVLIDVDQYIDEAAAHSLAIKYVIETHLHADFVSGHRELAARTGAEIVFGQKAGAMIPHRAVTDGDELTI